MRVGIHQPNFIPNYSFFLKMEISDVFVILSHVQFSKAGFQNYQSIFGEKWLLPVRDGNIPIMEKTYVNGNKLFDLNMHWIMAMAKTLGIDTRKIKYDSPSNLTKTERLVDICKQYGATRYVTNPDAVKKYLDKNLMEENGIKLLGMDTKEKRHIFELFNDIGIEKTTEMLKRESVKIISDHYKVTK